MAATRVDLRGLVRRELADTVAPYFWADAQLDDDLAAGFADYSYAFPNRLTALVTSVAGQTTMALGGPVVLVEAVTIDGETMPQVADVGTLYEPATRGTPSERGVQPVNPVGVSASHAQVWALVNGGVTFRYPLTAGRALVVYYGAAHVLPSDDATPVTIADADLALPVLYACDRLVRAAHMDAVKRGAPGAVVGREETGYRQRYEASLRARRGRMRSGQLMVAQ